MTDLHLLPPAPGVKCKYCTDPNRGEMMPGTIDAHIKLVHPILPSTGAKSFNELSCEPPPPPLFGEFMANDEDTIIFGPGGSTKGTTAAWWSLEIVRANPSAFVYVLDFEHHPEEWGGRMRRLGASDEEMDRIHYASPFSPDWTYPQGLLPDVVQYVKEDCERLGVTLLIIDSITAATEAGEAMGGAKEASVYFRALRTIGRRTLSLAHVTGNAEKWPQRPFGSVHLKSFCREMWAIEVVETRDAGPDTHGLTYAEVELRCRKAQQRIPPQPQVITYAYEPEYGDITAVLTTRQLHNGDMVYEVLRKITGGGWSLAAQIAKAVKLEFGVDLTEAKVYDAIRADMKSRNVRFEADQTKLPAKYRVVQS